MPEILNKFHLKDKVKTIPPRVKKGSGALRLILYEMRIDVVEKGVKK